MCAHVDDPIAPPRIPTPCRRAPSAGRGSTVIGHSGQIRHLLPLPKMRTAGEVPSISQVASPVKATLTSAKARIAAAIGIHSLAASTNYLLGVFMPLYAQRELGLSAADSMWPPEDDHHWDAAHWHLQPARIPLHDRKPHGVELHLLRLGVDRMRHRLSRRHAVFFLSELFPSNVRTTGLALIHNINFTVVGGLSLLICTWLAQQTGSKMIPAYYVMVTVGVALLCITYFRVRAKSTARSREALQGDL